MITGIHFDISSVELKEHFNRRVEHHKMKAAWYEKKSSEFKEGLDDEESRTKLSNSVSNPAEQFRSSMKQHLKKVGKFSFMRDHVIANETYRLEEADLINLELVEHAY